MSSETQFFIYYSKSQLLKTYPVKKWIVYIESIPKCILNRL